QVSNFMDAITGESMTPSSEDPIDFNARDGVEAQGGEGGGNYNAQERQCPPKRHSENVNTSTQSKEGDKRAKCQYCKNDACGDSKSGTTVMKNHLDRCKEYPPNIDNSQRLLSLQKLSKILGVPTDEDWDRITSMLPFLKLIYDASLRFSRSLNATSNVYFQELVAISKMIKKKSESSDFCERFIAHGMKRGYIAVVHCCCA
ncbi:Zinc finger BED domain-containing protein RICESLEEPER 1, partial [Bienertia sinuspersici]